VTISSGIRVSILYLTLVACLDGASHPTQSGATDVPYPDEPAGAVVLMDYDTDFGNATDPPWGDVRDRGNLSTVRDATAPVNPNVVGRVRFSVGCCDGTGPAELITGTGSGRGTPPSGWSRWYVSDWVKFDVNFRPHSCCQKLFEFYWWSGGDKWLLVKADPSGTGFPAIPRLTAEFADTPTQNLGGRPVVRAGRWYQYEVVIHRTGRVQLWVREQGGQPVSMFDGTVTGFGTPSNELLFWWWGYGGLGAYTGPTAYIYHNHMRSSYTR
jgi:hypothetical protein